MLQVQSGHRTDLLSSLHLLNSGHRTHNSGGWTVPTICFGEKSFFAVKSISYQLGRSVLSITSMANMFSPPTLPSLNNNNETWHGHNLTKIPSDVIKGGVPQPRNNQHLPLLKLLMSNNLLYVMKGLLYIFQWFFFQRKVSISSPEASGNLSRNAEEKIKMQKISTKFSGLL